jgi:uncharacterized heparinase superfamily protein
MSSLSLYFHTVRYLRPQQVYRRLWFRWTRPRVDTTPRPTLRGAVGPLTTVARRRPSLVEAATFSFLGVQGSVGAIGWDGRPHDKLWRYNQHYFDDLNASGCEARETWHRALLAQWLADNPPGQGSGWEPYPTSLRIVNWVKWQAGGAQLPEEALQSLATQARWLARRIEWHLLGNHLFANAKALVFAGLAFEGSEADRWLRLGLETIREQLPEQVLADGGNFERSPMYHAIFLEDLLDLINLAQSRPGTVDTGLIGTWRACASRMLGWLEAMCHPDGEIGFFNDAALGITPTPAELAAYALRLGLEAETAPVASGGLQVQHLASSGYVRLVTEDAVALLDVAPIGPDYLPGHAHADTLSFELSLFGERIVVNGGTSRYGSDALRHEERGTAAHSTVEIDGHDSSEVWGGFRVARRARPFGLNIQQDPESALVTCSHDGYRRLPGRPVHTRQWQLTPGRLRVQDRVTGCFEVAIARFHLHPRVEVQPGGEGLWTLRLPGASHAMTLHVLEGQGHLEAGVHAPEFGIRQPARTLAIRLNAGAQAVVEISWSSNH